MKLKEYLNTPFRRMMARNLALVMAIIDANPATPTGKEG